MRRNTPYGRSRRPGPASATRSRSAALSREREEHVGHTECPTDLKPSTILGLQQAVEERTVALERDAQFLGRDLLASLPLTFEPLLALGERLGEGLHHLGDEGIRGTDRLPRIIHERALDPLPPVTEPRLLGSEQGLLS